MSYVVCAATDHDHAPLLLFTSLQGITPRVGAWDVCCSIWGGLNLVLCCMDEVF